MAEIGWVDPEAVPSFWADAPDDADVLASYLLASYTQCLAYLPPELEVDPEDIPDRLKIAQIFQAKALYNSAISGPGDQLGGEGFTVTVFPMDWTVKNLLRPKRIGRVL